MYIQNANECSYSAGVATYTGRLNFVWQWKTKNGQLLLFPPPATPLYAPPYPPQYTPGCLSKIICTIWSHPQRYCCSERLSESWFIHTHRVQICTATAVYSAETRKSSQQNAPSFAPPFATSFSPCNAPFFKVFQCSAARKGIGV